MNKRQKAGVWLGRICSAVGTILILISLAWRWVYNIRGERYVGSIPFKVFWIGAFTMFVGLCILMIIKPTCNIDGTKKDKDIYE